jgi:hypothetical protein
VGLTDGYIHGTTCYSNQNYVTSGNQWLCRTAINGYVALIAEVENMVKDTGIFKLMYVL